MKCKICLNEIRDITLSYYFLDFNICKKCMRELKPDIKFSKIPEIPAKLQYFYKYSPKIREMLYLLKGSYDFEIASTFLERYKTYLNIKYAGFAVVFVPSYIEDDLKRGFNHVEAIFSFLKLRKLKIITKIDDIKQKDLPAKERKNIINHLKIDDVDLSKTKVLLVDDVMTTGSSIKACATLLKSKGAKTVKVLVVAKRFFEETDKKGIKNAKK